MGRRQTFGALVLAAVCAACTSSVTTDRATPSSSARPPSSNSRPSSAARAPTASPVPASGSGGRTRSAGSKRSAPRIPPVSARARAAGLRDIRTIVPDAVVDLRYATRHNFTGVRLYPREARCLVHRSMARGLRTAADRLRRSGYLLVFWDCYRPHYVQVRMFRIVPDPDWVARPGPYATSHEAGRSVDVTLAWRATDRRCPPERRVREHCLLRMGTGFDDFTPRAWAYASEGIGARARADRALLRRAMAAGGITVYSGEWWHFDGPGALVARPHLGAPPR